MSKKTETVPDASSTADSTSEAAKPRRATRRKPVYVFTPIETESKTLHDSDGMEVVVQVVPPGVTAYTCHLVEGGDGQTDTVRDILKHHAVDRDNLDSVMLFRAEPIDFELRMNPQLILRPRKD